MNKRLFVDVETTGLDPRMNGIWEIAALMEIDGEVVETFEHRCRPHVTDLVELQAFQNRNFTSPLLTSIESWDPKASAKNRHSLLTEVLGTFAPPMEVREQFVSFLGNHIDKFNPADKAHLIAYNAAFDADFLRQWFWKLGDKYYGSWFWTNALCIMHRAGWHLEPERHSMKNFKQRTVAEYLGIAIDETRLHEAMYDIELSRQILNTITAREGKQEEV